MNVSVLKKKVCLLYYLCLLDEKYFLFFVVFVPPCSTRVWRLAIVCVKFCNNIKRRYGRVNKKTLLFYGVFLRSLVCLMSYCRGGFPGPGCRCAAGALMCLCDGPFHRSDP